MIISIIGSGALGKTYGGLLALAGFDVHFLMRSEYTDIQKKGSFNIEIKDLQKTLTIEKPQIYTQSSDLPPSDLVIIALKTTANESIQSMLTACLKDNTIVMIIQNGLGSEEWVSQYTGQCPIVCGIATIGAGRGCATQVDVSFLGNLKIAPFRIHEKYACEAIVTAFAKAPVSLPITLHDHYREIRWFKLAWNIPFGALSIIFDQSTHISAGVEPYRSMVYQLIDEISAIAKADGVIISRESADQWVQFTKNAGYYMPTLYRDYHENKTLEKQYIFDHVLTIAKKYECVIPMLTLIEKQLSSILDLRTAQQL